MPIDDIRQTRLEKLEKLKKTGEEPYPVKTWRTHQIIQALENFDSYSQNRDYLVLAGRVRARREHGGSTFLDLQDSSGNIQIYLKKDKVGEREYALFSETIDIGDFLEVYGVLFSTKKNEKTLEVEKYRILSKAILPLPEKWHGIQDVEDRFRKRYLDLIFNPEVKDKFIRRSQIIQSIRDFMNHNDFMEVDTPILQPLYGGASARPFKTHLHALDIDLYLRIAPELYLKRLLVGGFERVYEFATNFRNEGMDRDHSPEFSVLEFYAAYKDHEWAMAFMEEMLETLVLKIFDTSEIAYQGHTINFKKPFPRISFNDLLKEHAQIDFDLSDIDDMRARARQLNIAVDQHTTKEAIADEIIKKLVRQHIIQPTYIIDYPIEMKPLAKAIKNSEYTASFQLLVGGFELVNAWSELNSPLDQRQRFEAQENNRAKGDEEAQRMDEDYIEALEYGMPPAAGVGLGIDRLVAMLTDSHSIREVILFPLMRPNVPVMRKYLDQ